MWTKTSPVCRGVHEMWKRREGVWNLGCGSRGKARVVRVLGLGRGLFCCWCLREEPGVCLNAVGKETVTERS